MKLKRILSVPATVALILAPGMARESAADALLAHNVAPVPAAAPTPVVHGTWSLYHAPAPPVPATAPAARLLHTAIFDAAGDRTIVFGGGGYGEAFNDTWSLSGAGAWTQLSTAGSLPDPRRDHTSIYDPVRNRMVVFGGSGYFNSFKNDVHTLSLTGTPTWSQMFPAGTPPPGRFSHAAFYDPPRDRMIVFGGYTGSFVNDIYQLTFSGTPTWSRIFPAGTPPAGRNALTTIYDPVRDRMLFFGGWDGTNFRADVWALNLSGSPVWTQVATSGSGPSARRHYAAVYDPVRDRIVLSGGESWAGLHNDTWALSLSGTPTWAAIAAGGPLPSPRQGHRAVLDPVRDRMIVFGGYEFDNLLNDAHALSLAPPATWSPIVQGSTATGPTPRRDHVAIYDPVRDRMLVFGGWDGTFRNDVWALSLSGPPAWTQVLPGGVAPPARFAHAAIYDAANDRMVVFGGYDGAFINDVWALSLSGAPAWSQIHPTGPSPAGRNAMTAIYDGGRQRMLLFGGWDGNAFRGDLWTLNMAGPPAWTQLTPANGPTPSARRHYAAAHDPARDQLVMACGLDGAYQNDAWTLALSNNDWRRLSGTSQQAPSGRDAVRGVTDVPRDRMVVFGGYDGQYLQDTWALSLTAPQKWTSLAPAGTPPAPRLLHTAIYDPIRDRILVFGGESNGNIVFNDTWVLDFGSALPAGTRGRLDVDARSPSQERVPEFALRSVRPNPWSGTEGLTVNFSLPGSGPAQLELFTVSGQRVFHREVGGFGGGSHDLLLEPGARLAPGMYMVRLSSSRGTVVAKVAKLR